MVYLERGSYTPKHAPLLNAYLDHALFLGQEHHLINCVNTMPPTPSLPLPYGMEEDYAAVNLPRTDVHAPVPGCSMKLLFP